MEIKDLAGKLVAVLGYGMEGKATAEYLLKHGINPVLFDHKPWDEWTKEQQAEIKSLNVNFIFGPDAFKELAGFDVVFRSPGLPLSKIRKLGMKAEITSQTKWFFEHCPCKIVGVTGTKGKGTTSSLISEILKMQCQISDDKYQIFLTGNIGKIQPFEFLDDLQPNDMVVYEMSSFQLHDLDRSPHVAVVLMVTQEHLDHHATVEEYREAKSSIVKYQTKDDFAIINFDYPASRDIGEKSPGTKWYFSRTNPETQCFVKNGVFIRTTNGVEKEILPVADLCLRGQHNWENAAAAVLAAKALNVQDSVIADVLRTFKGLPHRLEPVGETNGVKYFNDSFSTTPETSIAAIQAFTEPKILILGGSSKKSDFTELANAIAGSQSVKGVILIGDEADRIMAELKNARLDPDKTAVIFGLNTMPEIVAEASRLAERGDVVLLSPACASFGLFKNYKDRGDQFREAVAKLSNRVP